MALVHRLKQPLTFCSVMASIDSCDPCNIFLYITNTFDVQIIVLCTVMDVQN